MSLRCWTNTVGVGVGAVVTVDGMDSDPIVVEMKSISKARRWKMKQSISWHEFTSAPVVVH